MKELCFESGFLGCPKYWDVLSPEPKVRWHFCLISNGRIAFRAGLSQTMGGPYYGTSTGQIHPARPNISARPSVSSFLGKKMELSKSYRSPASSCCKAKPRPIWSTPLWFPFSAGFLRSGQVLAILFLFGFCPSVTLSSWTTASWEGISGFIIFCIWESRIEAVNLLTYTTSRPFFYFPFHYRFCVL